MTLAELTRDASTGIITNHETIRAVIAALADMPAEGLFATVRPDSDPTKDLLTSVGLEKGQKPCVSDVFVEIHQETTNAIERSHVRNASFYSSNLRALSLLSQIPGLYLPAIRSREEDYI